MKITKTLFSYLGLPWQTTKQKENNLVEQALAILYSRLQQKEDFVVNEMVTVKSYLSLYLLGEQREVFSCLFLDSQHRLIESNILFYGSVNGCSVHAREVIKKGLSLNAAAVIFAHNHPSGYSEPSEADINLTKRLKSALSLVEIVVLDHFIVGEKDVFSFAEKQLLG